MNARYPVETACDSVARLFCKCLNQLSGYGFRVVFGSKPLSVRIGKHTVFKLTITFSIRLATCTAFPIKLPLGGVLTTVEQLGRVARPPLVPRGFFGLFGLVPRVVV